MSKEKNIDHAKAVFAKRNVAALFFTNDGQAFYEQGPATVHQKELTGKTDGVHKVNNGNYAEVTTAVVEDTVSMDEETTEVTDEESEKKEKIASAKPRKKE